MCKVTLGVACAYSIEYIDKAINNADSLPMHCLHDLPLPALLQLRA